VRPIRSIICFNPGSAGDLLKALCLDASQYQLESHGGILLKNQYFKTFTEKVYYQTAEQQDINFELVHQVDNTHFYMDFYNNISEQVFYINYAYHLQIEILSAVNRKRYHNNWDEFISYHFYSIPAPLQKYISTKNAVEVFNIMWFKNLKEWRSNKKLIPIELADFFQYDAMKKIVENVTGKKITNFSEFDHTYHTWIKLNSDLLDLFCK